MTKIKAICFDLDGVFFTNKGKQSFQTALTTEFRISEQVARDFMTSSPEMSKLVRGQIRPEEFWQSLRDKTGITATDKELTERWVKDYEVDEKVKDAVISAKRQGYITCVCTNNNAIRLPILVERFRLNDLFDNIVSSHNVKHCKPEKEIFEALVTGARVKPEELVYSDDNPDRLKGAEELGIKTFQFHNFEQFLSKLNEFGVNLGSVESELKNIQK